MCWFISIHFLGQKSRLLTLNNEKKLGFGLKIIEFLFSPSHAPHQLKVDGVTIKCLHFESKKRFKALISRLFSYFDVSTKLTSKLKFSFFILE